MNTTVVFPAPLMTTIREFGGRSLAREFAAASSQSEPPSGCTERPGVKPVPVVMANGNVSAATTPPDTHSSQLATASARPARSGRNVR